MVSSEEIRILSDFGLTYTQSRLYLCLNKFGTLNAKAIASLSKTPRQDTYRVLSELFELGLVEKIVTKPVEFTAIPLDKGLNLLLQRRNEESQKLEKESLRIINASISMNRKEAESKPQIVLVPPKEPILIETEKLLSKAHETVSVLSPPQNMFPWIHAHQQLFEEALKRKVKLRFITTRTEDEALPKLFKKQTKNEHCEIRFIPSAPTVSFGIYDKRKVILELSAKDGFLKSQAFVSNNPCLVELASLSFESVWGQAEKIVVD